MQFQQTMTLKEYNWTIGMSFMTWIEKWQKLKMHFEDLQIHHKDAQITNGPWHPLPFLTTLVLLHQKLPTIITKLAYFTTFIGGPKGGRALLCFYWWVPNVFKKESSSFKGKRKKKKKKKSFLEFGVPKCIPYDSFMFPPSAQWFF